MTNRHLINYHDEISRWIQQGSVMVLFEKDKIQRFLGHNRVRYQSTVDRLNNIARKYLEYDGDRAKENDGKLVPLEGMKIEDFERERNELLDLEIKIAI